MLFNFHYLHLSIYKGVKSRELRELESSLICVILKNVIKKMGKILLSSLFQVTELILTPNLR